MEHRSCAQPSAELVVLTNMQWFYGPTWGRTLNICTRPGSNRNCAQWDELHSRQLELLEVLRRNAAHPAVAEVHVLVGEADPIRSLVQQLPWHARHGCKLRLVQASAGHAHAHTPHVRAHVRPSSALLQRPARPSCTRRALARAFETTCPTSPSRSSGAWSS